MKKLLIGISIVVVIALIGWRFMDRTAQAGGGGGKKGAPTVEVAKVSARTILQEVQSVGNVESPYKVEISPKNAGRIAFLEVREGDRVHSGQLLLRIDPSDLGAAVLQQEAAVAEARARFAQAKLTQNAAEVGIKGQIQQQQAGLNSAEAGLKQIQKNVEAQIAGARAQVAAAKSAVNSAQVTLEKEKVSLKNAQIKYDRTYGLYSKGYIAAQDIDDARTAVDVQNGAVKLAEEQLSAAKSQLEIQQQNVLIATSKGATDVAVARATASQAQAAAGMARANRSQSPAYRENLGALQSQIEAARAQLRQSQLRLADNTVSSPIEGTVTARKSDPGALATPGTPVLEVQYLDWLFIAAPIPLEAAGRIHEGQSARITFDDLPGQEFFGKITNINLAADPINRQFAVKIRLENSKHLLRPGMYARINIVTQTIEAKVVLPREAINTSPEGVATTVVVDEEGIAHIRKIKLGASDGKGVEVLSGVSPGERVVILTFNPLKDGQKVTIAKHDDGGEKDKAKEAGK